MSENLNIGYLVTDENDKSFPNFQWNLDTCHTEENENYYFHVYRNLNLAKFLQPAFENYQKPNYWKVQYQTIEKNQCHRNITKSCKAIEKCDNIEPTDEQRFNLAALLSLNYIKNKVFVGWVMQYLKNIDRSYNTANAVVEKLRLNMIMDIPDEEIYITSTHALVNAVLTNNYRLYCANSSFRLISDAPPQLYPEVFADTVMNTSTEKLVEIIEASI